MTTLSVGDKFTLKQDFSEYSIGGGTSYTISAGTPVEIKRVGLESIWIRGLGVSRWDTESKEVTIPVRFATTMEELAERAFGVIDPNYVPPRKLGEKPEGDFIDSDDPRIQWIFDDMAAVATKHNYCGYYDELASEVGFPGRPKNFTIKATVNGFEVSKKYKVRSRKEAQALFDAEILEVAEADLAQAVKA